VTPHRSTGLFDQAFVETLIDYADFQAADDSNWYRLDTDTPGEYGGMHLLTDAMQQWLAKPGWPRENSTPFTVTTSSPVVALADDGPNKKINVTVAGRAAVAYDMVFNTTAMSPLQHMDLKDLGLSDDVLTGIRTLSYDRATKVAIRFTRPWWHPLQPGPSTVYGGISTSDLPISNVVYPSWNDGEDKHATLIVSYSWSQDATRMASLVPDYSQPDRQPKKEDAIVTLCLNNLVTLWKDQPYRPSFKDLSDMYVGHHAWAWEHDPWTGGAFALFGPGQFANVYPLFLGLQCENKLALCGEALSAHHAWISGALDSAYQQLYHFLLANGRGDDMLQLFLSDLFGSGVQSHVDEMDEELVKWNVLLGEGRRPHGWGDELGLGEPTA